MTLKYNDVDKIKVLSSIQAEYSEWFSVVCTAIAYIDQRNDVVDLIMPESFSVWVTENQNDDDFLEYMQPIVDMYEEMKEAYILIEDELSNHKKPDIHNFTAFKVSLNGLIANLNRLTGQEGTENLDGRYHNLKSAIDIKNDLNKEMERLARNGNPFSLAMVRIDGFEGMGHSLQDAIKIISENILKSIRPFDDVYFIEKGYFLLSLKHADMVGTNAAIGRLQQALLLDQNNKLQATISSCVAEPVTGDEINDLLQIMRKDLKEHENDKETVLKFLDVSPLQRYINTQT